MKFLVLSLFVSPLALADDWEIDKVFPDGEKTAYSKATPSAGQVKGLEARAQGAAASAVHLREEAEAFGWKRGLRPDEIRWVERHVLSIDAHEMETRLRDRARLSEGVRDTTLIRFHESLPNDPRVDSWARAGQVNLARWERLTADLETAEAARKSFYHLMSNADRRMAGSYGISKTEWEMLTRDQIRRIINEVEGRDPQASRLEKMKHILERLNGMEDYEVLEARLARAELYDYQVEAQKLLDKISEKNHRFLSPVLEAGEETAFRRLVKANKILENTKGMFRELAHATGHQAQTIGQQAVNAARRRTAFHNWGARIRALVQQDRSPSVARSISNRLTRNALGVIGSVGLLGVATELGRGAYDARTNARTPRVRAVPGSGAE